jgi:hypothetical protein
VAVFSTSVHLPDFVTLDLDPYETVETGAFSLSAYAFEPQGLDCSEGAYAGIALTVVRR